MHARFIASALGALTVCTALANEQDPASGSVWVTSGFVSKHTSQQHAPAEGWNENNAGIGIEYVFSSNWLVEGGAYKNSVYKRSHYAQVVWSPDLVTWSSGDWKVRLGTAVGVVDGYPRMAGGGYFPTLLPVASAHWKRVGVNLTYVPSIAGNVAGALALQAKFRLL